MLLTFEALMLERPLVPNPVIVFSRVLRFKADQIRSEIWEVPVVRHDSRFSDEV